MATGVASRTRLKKGRRKSNIWPRARFITTLLFFALIAGTLWNGSTCSIDLGVVEIACPLGVVQLLAAAGQVIPVLLLAGLGGFLIIVFFGRAFCSWICPGRWIFNRGPVRDTKPWRARAWMQRIILGGAIGAAWACHTPVFCVICPAGVICRGAIAAGTGGSLLPTFGWLGTVIGIEWAFGRSWCRDLCPLGAMFSRLSRFNPFLKVEASPQACIPCTACRSACPENLSLYHDRDFTSCTKCLSCLPACPRDAIELKVW